jgi:hypothetical protein
MSRRVAFFDLNALSGAPLNQVHRMVGDVRERIGAGRCGLIQLTEPNSDGRYLIIFHNRDAADLFERMYRQTGRPMRRTPQEPDDVVVITVEEAVAAIILQDLHAFMRYMQAAMEHRSRARWN